MVDFYLKLEADIMENIFTVDSSYEGMPTLDNDPAY